MGTSKVVDKPAVAPVPRAPAPHDKLTDEKLAALQDGITQLKLYCDDLLYKDGITQLKLYCDDLLYKDPATGQFRVMKAPEIVEAAQNLTNDGLIEVNVKFSSGTTVSATFEAHRWASANFQQGTYGAFEEFQKLSFEEYAKTLPSFDEIRRLIKAYNAGHVHGRRTGPAFGPFGPRW